MLQWCIQCTYFWRIQAGGGSHPGQLREKWFCARPNSYTFYVSKSHTPHPRSALSPLGPPLDPPLDSPLDPPLDHPVPTPGPTPGPSPGPTLDPPLDSLLSEPVRQEAHLGVWLLPAVPDATRLVPKHVHHPANTNFLCTTRTLRMYMQALPSQTCIAMFAVVRPSGAPSFACPLPYETQCRLVQ